MKLIDLLDARGIAVPPEIAEIRRLGPYAAEFRYEDIPADSTEPLDRQWVVQCVAKTKAWADRLLAQPGGS